MSAAVYAVHAARWARTNQRATIQDCSSLRRPSTFSRCTWATTPKSPKHYTDVVYNSFLKEWEQEQARLLSRCWRGRLKGLRQEVASRTKAVKQWTLRNPITTSSLAGLVSTVASDFLVQRYFEKRESTDLRRSAIMGFFGLSYIGFLQHFLYTGFWPMFLKASRLTGPKAVVFQVFGDQGIYMPCAYLPVFYTVKEMAGPTGLFITAPEAAVAGVARYWQNVTSDLQLCYCYWLPMQGISFSLIPTALRVVFMSAASLGWQLGLGAAMLRSSGG
ncbi:unnamed protein product [Symbiodinium natans]|uniref:Uncharacterized protein n=1 Tax=Symbiodinium natans TaxID=878477 RepID=A0A812Q814_9DINO|nr:unnamed protein product [Symbiodinium natans]